MTYLISGISGWLGRASVHVLMEKFDVKAREIVGIGREREKISIGHGESITVLTWDDVLISDIKPKAFLHFAFVTKDKLSALGLEQFVDSNRSIIQSVQRVIRALKPECVLTVSSGAVYKNFGSSDLHISLKEEPYGFLKLEEENAIIASSREIGAAHVINRLFNLSGADVQNTEPFVLANFILSALSDKRIVIKSDFEVFRRYIDARELLELLLVIANRNESIVFDSGGPLIEIRSLAEIIARKIDGHVRIDDPGISPRKNASRYYSTNNTYDEFCLDLLTKPPTGIDQQVQNTISGLLKAQTRSF